MVVLSTRNLIMIPAAAMMLVQHDQPLSFAHARRGQIPSGQQIAAGQSEDESNKLQLFDGFAFGGGGHSVYLGESQAIWSLLDIVSENNMDGKKDQVMEEVFKNKSIGSNSGGSWFTTSLLFDPLFKEKVLLAPAGDEKTSMRRSIAFEENLENWFYRLQEKRDAHFEMARSDPVCSEKTRDGSAKIAALQWLNQIGDLLSPQNFADIAKNVILSKDPKDLNALPKGMWDYQTVRMIYWRLNVQSMALARVPMTEGEARAAFTTLDRPYTKADLYKGKDRSQCVTQEALMDRQARAAFDLGTNFQWSATTAMPSKMHVGAAKWYWQQAPMVTFKDFAKQNNESDQDWMNRHGAVFPVFVDFSTKTGKYFLKKSDENDMLLSANDNVAISIPFYEQPAKKNGTIPVNMVSGNGKKYDVTTTADSIKGGIHDWYARRDFPNLLAYPSSDVLGAAMDGIIVRNQTTSREVEANLWLNDVLEEKTPQSSEDEHKRVRFGLADGGLVDNSGITAVIRMLQQKYPGDKETVRKIFMWSHRFGELMDQLGMAKNSSVAKFRGKPMRFFQRKNAPAPLDDPKNAPISVQDQWLTTIVPGRAVVAHVTTNEDIDRGIQGGFRYEVYVFSNQEVEECKQLVGGGLDKQICMLADISPQCKHIFARCIEGASASTRDVIEMAANSSNTSSYSKTTCGKTVLRAGWCANAGAENKSCAVGWGLKDAEKCSVETCCS